jgi:hypothetical protein
MKQNGNELKKKILEVKGKVMLKGAKIWAKKLREYPCSATDMNFQLFEGYCA